MTEIPIPAEIQKIINDGMEFAKQGNAILLEAQERFKLDREQLVERIKKMVALGDQMERARIIYYREAGRYLKALKKKKPQGISWPAFLKEQNFEFGKSRADELIRIFDGHTTIEEVREEKKKRVRKSRAKKRPLRSGRAAIDNKKELEANSFIRELFEFIKSFGEQLKHAEHGFSQEDREALQSALHQCANELTLLAQSLDIGGSHDTILRSA